MDEGAAGLIAEWDAALEGFVPNTQCATIAAQTCNGLSLETKWTREGILVATVHAECGPTSIHWAALSTSEPGGLLKALILALYDHVEAWGIQEMTCAAMPGQGTLFESVGFVPVAGYLLSAEVNPSSRMAEYRTWVQGGEVPSACPAWRTP